MKYKLYAALDTETVNISNLKISLPVCWQIGTRGGDIRIVRTLADLHEELRKIVKAGIEDDFTPVVAVHNLGYDLHFLMPYIKDAAACGYAVDCCFKSSVKPLAVKLSRGKHTLICFWDTLSFSGMGLAKMGVMCGAEKAVGDWNYSLIRTTETPLTADEVNYATQDIDTIFKWFDFWERLNPDIDITDLGNRILTKTSVVRNRTKNLSSSRTWGEFQAVCLSQIPKTDNDYNLMIRSTSAGWAFTASEQAGRAHTSLIKLDATSMHPSHMVTHAYPVNFHIVNKDVANRMIADVFDTKPEKILSRWAQPFDYAFNARIRFKNIRLRDNSIFERDGVALHGIGLFEDYKTDNDDSESSDREFNRINSEGYSNIAVNATWLFGKLVRADEIVISLNELNCWVHSRVYSWDSFEVLEMSATGSYTKPPEFVFESVHTMYQRKSIIKDAIKSGQIPDLEWIPEAVRNSDIPIKEFYGSVKADLNSLYGMFATNEFKESIVFECDHFEYDGVRGLAKEVKHPKAWYQFGLRVAAWSRVQQCIAIETVCNANPNARIVNGDTDSFAIAGIENSDDALKDLETLHSRIYNALPDSLKTSGMGAYEQDCKPSIYCAVANKRYAYIENCKLTVHSAGMATTSSKLALEYELSVALRSGLSFEKAFAQACIYSIGYYACYVGDLANTRYRKMPKHSFGTTLDVDVPVIDYQGNMHVYPIGTPVGIYLQDCDKMLGAGYDADNEKCCKNAVCKPRHIHHYEKRDDTVERWEKWE